MVEAYWQIGKEIVNDEQKGNKRADYGKEVLKLISNELTKEFGRGFSLTNLKNYRKFYLLFQPTKKGQTLSDQLKTLNPNFNILTHKGI